MFKNSIDIIYLVTAIYFAVFVLFELVVGVSASNQYNVLAAFRSLLVPLALAFVEIILSRVSLEGIVTLVGKNNDKQE